MGGREVVAELQRRGFAFRTAKGSHRFGKHPDGRTVTVPMHKELDRGTLHAIERQSKEKLR